MQAAKRYPITFITGNAKKLEEFLSIITGSPLEQKFNVTNKAFDLDELQGSPEYIAARKAKEATQHCDTAVMIEDVSLCFKAMKGLPGPYIKDFLTKLDSEERALFKCSMDLRTKQHMLSALSHSVKARDMSLSFL